MEGKEVGRLGSDGMFGIGGRAMFGMEGMVVGSGGKATGLLAGMFGKFGCCDGIFGILGMFGMVGNGGSVA